MKFSEKDLEYLKGGLFSNGRRFHYSFADGLSTTRIDDILDRVHNKRVIHIGFTDHIPLIKAKMEKSKWLHQRLISSCEHVVGIDINEEAVNYVKEEFGINNVYSGDITMDDFDEIKENHWDYLILGEVLEHIDDPVSFLSEINRRFRGCVDAILITVPNAFELGNIINIFRHIEHINTDHRFWFTPYTLAKVISRARYRDIELSISQSNLPRAYWQRILLKRFPLFRETLIAEAKFE